MPPTLIKSLFSELSNKKNGFNVHLRKEFTSRAVKVKGHIWEDWSSEAALHHSKKMNLVDCIQAVIDCPECSTIMCWLRNTYSSEQKESFWTWEISLQWSNGKTKREKSKSRISQCLPCLLKLGAHCNREHFSIEHHNRLKRRTFQFCNFRQRVPLEHENVGL